MSSAAASHAKTFLTLDSAQVSVANDPASGASLGVSLARYDRGSRSWRTLQLSLFEGFSTFSETLPICGMTRNGECLALARQEHVARRPRSSRGHRHQAPGGRVPEQPAQGVRPARRKHAGADAELHGGRQRRGGRDLRGRPPWLRAAGRRRDRLRKADQHFRRRLRHRMRQHGRAAGYQVLAIEHKVMRSSVTCSGHFVRRRPHQ
jgi:hypothetical protein